MPPQSRTRSFYRPYSAVLRFFYCRKAYSDQQHLGYPAGRIRTPPLLVNADSHAKIPPTVASIFTSTLRQAGFQTDCYRVGDFYRFYRLVRLLCPARHYQVASGKNHFRKTESANHHRPGRSQPLRDAPYLARRQDDGAGR